MIALRVFSEQGIDKFREYIQSLKYNSLTQRPDFNIEPYSYEFQPQAMIDETRIFLTRLELGDYLIQYFEKAGIGRSSIIGNRGLLTWLAYLWFDQLCPLDDETREVRQTARYICSSDYRTYYRHYIAASYYIYSLYGQQNSRLFLYNPLHKHNDFIEEFASRQDRISSKNLIEVAHQLYWDASSDRPKRGAQSKKKRGNHRRLLKVIDQLELTYDIFTMTAGEIINLLPDEFDDWIR